MVSGEIPQEKEGRARPEITLIKGTTQAFIRPTEGGIVSRFRVDNTDIFFQDQIVQTPVGPKRRGGNPLLFPNAGPITQTTNEFTLPQHGFARDRKWIIKDMSPDRRSMVLGLTSNDQTKSIYPYDFELELAISVEPRKLREELKVTNRSQKPMPIAPGFHPYFHVPLDKRGSVSLNIPGFDPAEFDWNSSPDFPRQTYVLLQVPGSGEISIKSSDEFKRLVVWSEPDLPHLCVEPWTRDEDAILDPKERIEIQPGETLDLWIEIGFQKESG